MSKKPAPATDPRLAAPQDAAPIDPDAVRCPRSLARWESRPGVQAMIGALFEPLGNGLGDHVLALPRVQDALRLLGELVRDAEAAEREGTEALNASPPIKEPRAALRHARASAAELERRLQVLDHSLREHADRAAAHAKELAERAAVDPGVIDDAPAAAQPPSDLVHKRTLVAAALANAQQQAGAASRILLAMQQLAKAHAQRSVASDVADELEAAMGAAVVALLRLGRCLLPAHDLNPLAEPFRAIGIEVPPGPTIYGEHPLVAQAEDL